MTRRSPSGYGSGRMNRPLNTLNTVVFAPIAIARTAIDASAYTGLAVSARKA